VVPSTAELASGANRQFVVVGTYSDNSTQNLTTSVTWNSSAASVASIGNAPSSHGLATAVAQGTTSITAAVGTIVSAPSTLNVGTYSEYAYVANGGDGTVSQFVVSGANLIALSPVTVTAGATPQMMMTVDPSGTHAYVVNGDGSVSQFAIGPGGGLTLLNPAAIQVGIGLVSLTVDPTGRYAYAVVGTGSSTPGVVAQFTIGNDGTLAAMTPATAPTGDNNPLSISVDPTGRYAYVVNGSFGSVSQYSIAPSGGLTPLNPSAVLNVSLPQSIAIDPSGRYVYVTSSGLSGTDSVYQYTIEAGGTLTPMSPASVTTPSFGMAIAIDPTGRYLYVADGAEVDQFNIGETSGGLTAMSPQTVPAGVNPVSISVDPNGLYAYVANEDDSTVTVFPIVTGALNATSSVTVSVGLEPISVVTTY
jgi:6-phosphogluconolactonase (cycloisomerase 2 family)